MKKSDIASLIMIISVVAVSVFFAVKFVVGDRSMKPVEVKTAQPISSTITQPSSKIFNEQAINPTVPITIEGGDQKPIGN